MSRRPAVFVLALTVGDYLLWNWSLNGNHDVLALVSGLTLPPLALVSFWILAMGAMRLLAAVVQRPRPVAAPQARARSAGAALGTEQAEQTAAATRESSRIAA